MGFKPAAYKVCKPMQMSFIPAAYEQCKLNQMGFKPVAYELCEPNRFQTYGTWTMQTNANGFQTCIIWTMHKYLYLKFLSPFVYVHSCLLQIIFLKGSMACKFERTMFYFYTATVNFWPLNIKTEIKACKELPLIILNPH